MQGVAATNAGRDHRHAQRVGPGNYTLTGYPPGIPRVSPGYPSWPADDTALHQREPGDGPVHCCPFYTGVHAVDAGHVTRYIIP